MDSRIREAYTELLSYVEDDLFVGVFGLKAKNECVEAISLLTAEPEPCEDARQSILALTEKMQDFSHRLLDRLHSSTFEWKKNKEERALQLKEVEWEERKAWIVLISDYLDAYASHREQAARADERRRWAAILDRAMEFVRIYAQDNPKWTPAGMSEQDPHGVHALIAEVAAILQGTEPDSESLQERIHSVFTIGPNEMFSRARAEVEPAKVSTALEPCLYTLSKDKAPYPRVSWDCSCGFRYARMHGYITDEYGNPSNTIDPPSGKCMKCHRTIATEPTTVELPKCDHCGAIACGTDCDGSSHYTPEKKE